MTTHILKNTFSHKEVQLAGPYKIDGVLWEQHPGYATDVANGWVQLTIVNEPQPETPLDFGQRWGRTKTDDLQAGTRTVGWEAVTPTPEHRAAAINHVANSRINAVVPEAIKTRYIARYAELLDKLQDGEVLTEAETAERATLKNLWTWIKATLAEAERLKADANLTVLSAQWPAYTPA